MTTQFVTRAAVTLLLSLSLWACSEDSAPPTATQAAAPAPVAAVTDPERLALGKEIAEDRSRGNCLACHLITGGEFAGNIGPPLIAMQARYPDRQVLLEQIADATVRNPESVMPPFGRNRILTEDELEALTDYILTL